MGCICVVLSRRPSAATRAATTSAAARAVAATTGRAAVTVPITTCQSESLEFEESDLRAESEHVLQLASMKGGKGELGSGKEGKMFNNNYNLLLIQGSTHKP